MNGEDVFGGIIDYGGEEGSFLFNMVCKSWVKVHGEKKKYTTTSAIMTSHPRLGWAVDAGWNGGDKALAFQLAVASGSAEVVDLIAEWFPPGHNAETYEGIKDGVDQAAVVDALAMTHRLEDWCGVRWRRGEYDLVGVSGPNCYLQRPLGGVGVVRQNHLEGSKVHCD